METKNILERTESETAKINLIIDCYIEFWQLAGNFKTITDCFKNPTKRDEFFKNSQQEFCTDIRAQFGKTGKKYTLIYRLEDMLTKRILQYA